MKDRIIVSKMNEYLYTATQELCTWLNNMLPRVSDEWWRECVLENLSHSQRELALDNNFDKLEQFDLAALLRIADKSWYDMRSFAYLPTSDRECVRAMMKVRNNWAHFSGSVFDKDMVIKDLNVILNFFEAVIITNKYTEDIRDFSQSVENSDFSAVYEEETTPTISTSEVIAANNDDIQETVTNEVVIKVVKDDKEWKVVSDDAFVDAILGGLSVAAEELENAFSVEE